MSDNWLCPFPHDLENILIQNDSSFDSSLVAFDQTLGSLQFRRPMEHDGVMEAVI